MFHTVVAGSIIDTVFTRWTALNVGDGCEGATKEKTWNDGQCAASDEDKAQGEEQFFKED